MEWGPNKQFGCNTPCIFASDGEQMERRTIFLIRSNGQEREKYHLCGNITAEPLEKIQFLLIRCMKNISSSFAHWLLWTVHIGHITLFYWCRCKNPRVQSEKHVYARGEMFSMTQIFWRPWEPDMSPTTVKLHLITTSKFDNSQSELQYGVESTIHL